MKASNLFLLVFTATVLSFAPLTGALAVDRAPTTSTPIAAYSPNLHGVYRGPYSGLPPSVERRFIQVVQGIQERLEHDPYADPIVVARELVAEVFPEATHNQVNMLTALILRDWLPGQDTVLSKLKATLQRAKNAERAISSQVDLVKIEAQTRGVSLLDLDHVTRQGYPPSLYTSDDFRRMRDAALQSAFSCLMEHLTGLRNHTALAKRKLDEQVVRMTLAEVFVKDTFAREPVLPENLLSKIGTAPER